MKLKYWALKFGQMNRIIFKQLLIIENINYLKYKLFLTCNTKEM